jgi:hypothetical protein
MRTCKLGKPPYPVCMALGSGCRRLSYDDSLWEGCACMRFRKFSGCEAKDRGGELVPET